MEAPHTDTYDARLSTAVPLRWWASRSNPCADFPQPYTWWCGCHVAGSSTGDWKSRWIWP